jgi:YHS domain-containing protein
MEESQATFKGWALVEVYGHSRAAGYVTTEYFGNACMFRVDTPSLPEREWVLAEPEYTDHGWTQAGATVKRDESPARSTLLGPGAIFRMTPCDEAAARRAIDEIYKRPVIVLKMPDRPAIAQKAEALPIDPVCGSEVGAESAYKAEHAGTVFFFCSSDCRSEFGSDPEAYLPEPQTPELEL